jgi:thymidylate synthase (FAD)
MDESDEGLIRFLMRDRHGCYDDATEVLTLEGWKAWPDVSGDELFATRSRDGLLEYQPSLRLVRKEFRGHLVGFKGASVDLLVTPDHRMLASPQTTLGERRRPSYRLLPAHSLLWKAHRHVATSSWSGPGVEWLYLDDCNMPAGPTLSLVGFFVGDGNLSRSNHLVFRLRKQREIEYLRALARACHLPLKEWRHETYAIGIGPELRRLFAQCYDSEREKVIPRQLLALSSDLLEALWAGLRNSDGTVFRRGEGRADREVYSTTSRRLANQIQELALKLGRSASVRPHIARSGDGHYGKKPRWRITMYAARNSRPALCRTREQAQTHMGVENYAGAIHCVEVPNRTLYVRRNGYAVWCGNTPFEHNAFRYHIRSPIFVAREWMRHRIGSFNEFSLRYAKATEDFYIPDAEDVRSQVGKPGRYTFEAVEPELAEHTREELARVYQDAYDTYTRLVEAGVAREVARSVLPVGAYTEFYWTVNARALMNFVSLRAADTAQREIRRYAEAVEQLFAQHMPITYDAFVANNRTAP